MRCINTSWNEGTAKLGAFKFVHHRSRAGRGRLRRAVSAGRATAITSLECESRRPPLDSEIDGLLANPALNPTALRAAGYRNVGLTRAGN